MGFTHSCGPFARYHSNVMEMRLGDDATPVQGTLSVTCRTCSETRNVHMFSRSDRFQDPNLSMPLSRSWMQENSVRIGSVGDSMTHSARSDPYLFWTASGVNDSFNPDAVHPSALGAHEHYRRFMGEVPPVRPEVIRPSVLPLPPTHVFNSVVPLTPINVFKDKPPAIQAEEIPEFERHAMDFK